MSDVITICKEYVDTLSNIALECERMFAVV